MAINLFFHPRTSGHSMKHLICDLLFFGIVLFAVQLPAADIGTPENGVTAHRGNSSEFPENSMAAFRSAVRLGADWIELDVFKTKDGKLVICHDPQTGQLADGNLNVSTSTFEELNALDMAFAFRQARKLTETDCPRLSILLLEDVLRFVLDSKTARLSIHPKNDCVDDAVAMIRRLDAVAWVGFNDSNLQRMIRVKELEPMIPVFWDRFEWSDEDIITAKKHRFEYLVLHFNHVTAERVEAVHQAGLKFGVWTVNDPALMKKFLRLGVDRMYTDYPRVLLDQKRENYLRFD